MKAYQVTAWALLAFVALTSGVAYAEPLQGEVVSIDLEGNAIEVAKTDAATGATENVRISVTDTTTYAGDVTALEEMIEGDIVKLEVEKDATSGNWAAKSVEVSTAE